MIYSVVVELCREVIREYLDHSARSPMSWTFDTDGPNLRSRSKRLTDNRSTGRWRHASSQGSAMTTAAIVGSTSAGHEKRWKKPVMERGDRKGLHVGQRNDVGT